MEDKLAAVSYAIHIRGNRVRVTRYDGEPDMSEEIEQTFAKFKEGRVTDSPGQRSSDCADMNHVEAQILDLVASLHPEPFPSSSSTARAITHTSTRPSAASTAKSSSTSRISSTSSR